MNTNCGTKIVNKSNPEWGTWIIEGEYSKDQYEIRGSRGSKIVSKSDLERFWEETK